MTGRALPTGNPIHSDSEDSSSMHPEGVSSQETSEPAMTGFVLKTSSDVISPVETTEQEESGVSNDFSTPAEVAKHQETPSTSTRVPPTIPPKPDIDLGVLMGLSESHYELPPSPPPKPSKVGLQQKSSSNERSEWSDRTEEQLERPLERPEQPLNQNERPSERLSESSRLPLPPSVSWKRKKPKQEEDEEPMVPHREPPPLQPAKPLRRAPSLPSPDILTRPSRPAPPLTLDDDLYKAPPSRQVVPPPALQGNLSSSPSLHGSHGLPPPKPEKPIKPSRLFQSNSSVNIEVGNDLRDDH